MGLFGRRARRRTEAEDRSLEDIEADPELMAAERAVNALDAPLPNPDTLGEVFGGGRPRVVEGRARDDEKDESG